jgi:hypothetical protein
MILLGIDAILNFFPELSTEIPRENIKKTNNNTNAIIPMA